MMKHLFFCCITCLLLVCISCEQRPSANLSTNQETTTNWEDSARQVFMDIERYANLDRQDSLDSETPRALDFFRMHEEWYLYYYSWCILAETYTWNDRFDDALAEAGQMHEDALQRNNDFGLSMADRVIGLVYGVQGDFPTAVEYFQKALGSYPDHVNFPPKVDIYTYLCSCLDDLGRAAETDSTLSEWKDYLDAKFHANTDSALIPNFGNYYYCFFKTRFQFDLSQKNYAKAAADLDSAEYYEALEDNQIKAVIDLLTLRGDLAKVQGNFMQALACNDRAVALADSAGLNASFMLNALATRIRIYETQHDYEDAFKSFKDYAALKDSVIHTDNQQQLNELTKRFELDELRAQQEREQAAHERAFNRMLLFIAVIIVFSLVVFIFFRHRSAKRLEVAYDQLKIANARAEEASRMKTDFIQQISHEIRTPLNILSGFTQVITTPGLDLDDETKQEASQKIMENTDRITGLVNKMLELSEASSNAVIQRTDTVSVTQLANQAVDNASISSVDGVNFLQTIAPEAESLRVSTNLRYAARALSLLLDNARKFLAKPGMPAVGMVRLHIQTDTSCVRFVVEDTGIGIPAAESEHIFEEFVQLDEYYDGTGIGLSVARSIVRRLGGDITLDTTYGFSADETKSGARFVMTLPVM